MAEVRRNGSRTLAARVRPATPGDEIVISGVSGKFPNARNVSEFAWKLFNKVRAQKENFFYFKKKLNASKMAKSVPFVNETQ